MSRDGLFCMIIEVISRSNVMNIDCDLEEKLNQNTDQVDCLEKLNVRKSL